MIQNAISLIGFGGHARVICEILRLRGFGQIFIYDDDEKIRLLNDPLYTYRGKVNNEICGDAFIAIGDNKIRHELSHQLTNCNFINVVHPSAVIAGGVKIGCGSVLMAGVVIQSGTVIGEHAIINTGTVVDHDCQVGSFSHLGPKVAFAGNVHLGECSFVGVGASVINNISVGPRTMIGAGSVVLNDLPSDCLAFGVPAKPMKFYDNNGII